MRRPNKAPIRPRLANSSAPSSGSGLADDRDEVVWRSNGAKGLLSVKIDLSVAVGGDLVDRGEIAAERDFGSFLAVSTEDDVGGSHRASRRDI